MHTTVIGRQEEKALLDELFLTPKANLVAVYGRRRVGKTYLIRTHLKNNILFEYSGIHNVTTEIQLEKFSTQLSQQLNDKIPLPIAGDWFSALDMLKDLLQKKMRRKKIFLFLDEFPWLQTPKSNFLAAFENFWNSWASSIPSIVIILCGSSASWMIKNVIRNKGGLHNRITHKINLQPFTLAETEQFLLSKNIVLSHYQITQLYMAMGGIPHYLDHIKPGFSAAQIIEMACFNKNGFLYHEFDDLYKSLFDNAERHVKIIRALANKPMGLNRTEIIKFAELQTGGTTTSLLYELSSSSFITAYNPLGKKTKDAIYKLTDSFSLFYLKFMETNRTGAKGTWLKLSATITWKIWSGLAFETICLLHINAIKNALGISGIYTEQSIWKSNAVNKGNAAQIDLVIDRSDNCINLCELKFYENIFSIDKNYAIVLANKKMQFKQQTKTRKQLFITLITANGFEHNANSLGLIDHHITLDSLFLQHSF